MLLSEMITRVRERSRTSSDFTSDATVANAIDEAIKAFVQDTAGLRKYKYLDIEPKFWTSTTMAFALTIVGGTNTLSATDIVVTATDRAGVTGAQVATDLQAQIRAAGPPSLTVAFSPTTWKFTIDGIDATSLTLAAPSAIIYADCLEPMFGKSGTQTSTEWASAIPEDANLEIDLPSDFHRMRFVEWDRYPLGTAPFDLFASPELVGDPQFYQVSQDKKMRVYPVPQQQKLFQIMYDYLPQTIRDYQGYQECGLSAKIATTGTGLSTTTQYYFKVTEDGTQTEYGITTGGSDVTYAAVIILMNAQTTGSTFSLVDGDLRCTSDSQGTSATIALAAGTTGNDLFATLTGWSAFDTASSILATEIDIADEAEGAITLLASAIMWEEAGDEKRAKHYYARAEERTKRYKRESANRDTKYRAHATSGLSRRRSNYRVTM